MGKKYLYFIYLFSNNFNLSYIDLDESTKIVKLFINRDRNDLNKIHEFLLNDSIKIGYGNSLYESKISNYILKNIEEGLFDDLDPESICRNICKYSINISNDNPILSKKEVDLNAVYLKNKSINSLSNRIYIPSKSNNINIEFNLDYNKFDDFSDFCTKNILEIRLFYINVFNNKIIENEIIYIDKKIKELNKNKQTNLF